MKPFNVERSPAAPKPTATCQDCGKRHAVSALREPKHLHERLEPGDTYPAGECPACGALALLDETFAPGNAASARALYLAALPWLEQSFPTDSNDYVAFRALTEAIRGAP